MQTKNPTGATVVCPLAPRQKYENTLRNFCFILLFFPLLWSCQKQERKADNAAFTEVSDSTAGTSDMDSILAAGELIVTTLAGPATYYEYHEQPMGLQYALAANFAGNEGLRVRIELARDTVELLRLLHSGKADVAALPLPLTLIEAEGLTAAGVRIDSLHQAWAVRTERKQLAEALDSWFARQGTEDISQAEQQRMSEFGKVRRKVRSPFISREQGIISTYDDYFKQASKTTGWDWRLIAAQCYQESGFDPTAQSWAGACGLMQLMPTTAQSMGLAQDRIFQPQENVATAARYIRKLVQRFAHISDHHERTKFVLASYNAGPGHVQDAIALTKKYGGNPNRWDEVSYYILHLSEESFYRDPVVKHGYMIGKETHNYVSNIWNLWRNYGAAIPAMPPTKTGKHINGTASPSSSSAANSPQQEIPRANPKHSAKIITPDDPDFFK